MKRISLTLFISFVIIFITNSQDIPKYGKVIYIKGKANLQRGTEIYHVNPGDDFLKGDKLRLLGSMLMKGNSGNMTWLTEGVYEDSMITFSLISPRFVKYSYELSEMMGIYDEFSIEQKPYFNPLKIPCKTPMDTVDGLFRTCKDTLPIEPYLLKSYKQSGGIGKIFKPKVQVHVSDDAVNPRVEVYNVYHKNLLKVPLAPGFQGEVDLSDIKLTEKDRFLDFVFCDDSNRTSYFSLSQISHSMSLDNFELFRQKPFDELLYALKLYEHGCKMEALSSAVRAKKALPEEQKVLAEILLRRWFYCAPRAILKEPIIYMYGEKDLVTIDLSVNGSMDFSYPEYSKGWKFSVTKEGLMTSKVDSSKHRYLFWEGEIQSQRLSKSFQEGFCVNSDTLVAFLRNKLTEVGLNELEINDFIVFWAPQLKMNELNFIRFDVDDECDEFAVMHISPKPKSLKRVYMLYKPLTKVIEFKPQTFQRFDRNGFVVVEWGGVELVQGNFTKND